MKGNTTGKMHYTHSCFKKNQDESKATFFFFLESIGENPFPSSFQVLEAAHNPWLMGLFLHLQNQQRCAESSCFYLSGSPLLPPLTFKDLEDNIGFTQKVWITVCILRSLN